jgi:hypothetical protein
LERHAFTTAAVFPCQVAGPPAWPAEGPRKLMAAILDDALRCVSVDVPDKPSAEAARWIFSDDRSYAFSFLNVCDAVEMDPERLRHVARTRSRAIDGSLRRHPPAHVRR